MCAMRGVAPPVARRTSSCNLNFLELKSMMEAELSDARPGPLGAPDPAAYPSAPASPRFTPPPSPHPAQHVELQPPAPGLQHQRSAPPLPKQHNAPVPLNRQSSALPLRKSSLRLPGAASLKSLKSSSSSEALPQLSRMQQPICSHASPLHHRMEKRCNKALQLLERLLHRRGAVGAETLRPAAFRFCKGLVFISERKAGLLAGWDWGHGFVLRHFPDGTWSAPCFLRLRYASLGLTLGAQSIQSVSVLQTEAQVREFARDQAVCCMDCTMPSAYMDPLAVNEPIIKTLKHTDVSLPAGMEEPKVAMMSDGFIYDLSVRAGLSYVDDALNAAVYGCDGEAVTAQQVLSGLADPPREFLPLYRVLCDLAGSAQLTRRTINKYELERDRACKRSLAKVSSQSGNRMAPTEGSRGPGLQRSSSEWGASPSQPTSLAGGSPTSTLPLPPAGGGGGGSCFKLFEDVEVAFQEQHTYAQQEAEEAAAEGGAEQPTSGSGGVFKLFGDVEVAFQEQHTYAQQEAEEAAAAVEQRLQLASSGKDRN